MSARFSLLDATLVGLGAIVGGGILALAGVAVDQAGPAALVAFLLNGVLALLTATAFAELATASTESGGPYAFARQLLSIRTAFAVGWVLWSAYLVAAVLYAMGFAAFALSAVDAAFGTHLQAHRLANLVLALAATGGYAWSLLRGSGQGGQWATWGKLALFVGLILAGLARLPGAPDGIVAHGLSPFAPSGALGIASAMGATFIAWQGFDLVAAISGEVDRPARNVPRAMLVALGVTALIYLPLLFVMLTVGNPGGDAVALARSNPETLVVEAAGAYLGGVGRWAVLAAGVLSMLSALQANLLVAARVAAVMGRDRVLPARLAPPPDAPSPAFATQVTAVAIGFFVVMIPDVATAGAAASVVFLIVFTAVHGMAALRRRRGGPVAFRPPAPGLISVVGGVGCAGLAVYQVLASPQAAGVVLAWSGLGFLLYRVRFAERAEPLDALAEAAAPELLRSRGRQPLVLVPVARPARAPALIALAQTLAPRGYGKALLLTVVRPSAPDRDRALADAQAILGGALTYALAQGEAPEALLTVADSPWDEIPRVARSRRCAALVLGMAALDDRVQGGALERLLNELPDVDVAVLHAPAGWAPEAARRIMIPLGGQGTHDAIRARVLGSLLRTDTDRQVTFVRCVPEDDRAALAVAERTLADAAVGIPGSVARVLPCTDPTAALIAEARNHDLVLLGLSRHGRSRAFGAVTLPIAASAGAALMLAGADSGPGLLAQVGWPGGR